MLEGSKYAIPFLIKAGANLKVLEELSQCRAEVVIAGIRDAFEDSKEIIAPKSNTAVFGNYRNGYSIAVWCVYIIASVHI